MLAAKALIVEPDGALAQRLASALAGPAVVEIVPTAQAALAALTRRLPTLLVRELELSDADGRGFITQITASRAYHHVLIIVVTQRTAVRNKIAAFHTGAEDYLLKPVDVHAFVQRVCAVLDSVTSWVRNHARPVAQFR